MRNFRKTIRGFWRDSKGASALEFALVALPMIFFLFGIIEFGRALYTQQNLAYATDLASRQLYIDPVATDATLSTVISNNMDMIDPAKLSITLTSGSIGGVASRNISVNYQFDFLVPTIKPGGILLNHTRSVVLPE